MNQIYLIIVSFFSGLDNAGKTTILKRFNGEPIDTISPTLGFNIKTLEHKGEYLNESSRKILNILRKFQINK